MNKKEINKKALARVTKETLPMLNEINDIKNVKMPETVFKARFLDSFKKGGTATSVAEFTSIAGGPMCEIDIVDNAGEVLYTTPSIYAPVDLSDLPAIKKGDLSGTALAVVNSRNNGDANPNEVLDASIEMFSKDIMTKVKECSAVSNEAWKNIFKKYDEEEIIAENKLEFNYDD